jgi:hypothetical protein
MCGFKVGPFHFLKSSSLQGRRLCWKEKSVEGGDIFPVTSKSVLIKTVGSKKIEQRHRLRLDDVHRNWKDPVQIIGGWGDKVGQGEPKF